MLSTLSLLAVGCSNQVVVTHVESQCSTSTEVSLEQRTTLSETNEVIYEIFDLFESVPTQDRQVQISMGIVGSDIYDTDQPQPQPTSQPTQLAGPQLVAGDWLAWQCALVSNYWDMQMEDNARFALTPE